MCITLNILNLILGGFTIILGWLLTTLVNVMLIFTLSLTRSCWEVTKLSLVPYGSEAIHVDELNPAGENILLNTSDTVLNIFWLIFFDWWLCLMHIATGVIRYISIIGAPVSVANFKIIAIALWPADRHAVSIETVRVAHEANARRRFQ